ncbi:MAG TPA: hypothetical protein VJO99_23425, partial [Burkholderiaceae bacterium]|nr:hypothetical protein [Burkholderiaceae bacterium]
MSWRSAWLLAAHLFWLAPACAATSLAAWRDDAARVRITAENDAPLAYNEAQRLQATLPTDATAADRVRVLNLLSRIETYMALTKAAAAHSKEAYDLAEQNGDRIGQAESDLNVTLNAINQGKLDELVRATQHSLVMLEGVARPDLLGEAMLRTTIMYRRFEQFNESAETAVRAMEIARRSNDPLAMTYAHQGMAIAFFQGQHREQTKQHYERMRAYAQAARSKLLEAFAIGGLSAIALQVGDPVLAEQLGREAVTKYREVGAPFAIGFGLYAVADTLRLQKRHVEAIAALDEAIEVYRQYPNPIGLWFALNGRSADLEALGDLAR